MFCDGLDFKEPEREPTVVLLHSLRDIVSMFPFFLANTLAMSYVQCASTWKHSTCQRRQITMYNIFAYLELTLVSESLSACGIADDVGLYKECLVGYTVVEDCQIPYLDVPSDAFKIRCTRVSLPTDFCWAFLYKASSKSSNLCKDYVRICRSIFKVVYSL